MSIIADDLEEECRRTAHDMKRRSSEATPATFVAREIALTLDQIDTIRQRQKVFKGRLREKELYIDTQLMNIDKRIDLLPDWLQRTRLKNEFKRMLDRVETQLQRTLLESDSALRQLQVRLMELLNMHEQLSFEYGDTEGSA